VEDVAQWLIALEAPPPPHPTILALETEDCVSRAAEVVSLELMLDAGASSASFEARVTAARIASDLMPYHVA
jgi:hypothetical protein